LNEKVSLPWVLVRYSLWPLLITRYFGHLFNVKDAVLLKCAVETADIDQHIFLKKQIGT